MCSWEDFCSNRSFLNRILFSLAWGMESVSNTRDKGRCGICNHNYWEAELGELTDQPGLHSESLSPNKGEWGRTKRTFSTKQPLLAYCDSLNLIVIFKQNQYLYGFDDTLHWAGFALQYSGLQKLWFGIQAECTEHFTRVPFTVIGQFYY